MRTNTYMIVLAVAVIAAAFACIVMMEADDSDAAIGLTYYPDGGTITKEEGGSTTTVSSYYKSYNNKNAITIPGSVITDGNATYTFTKEGYTFAGWSRNQGATTPTYREGDTNPSGISNGNNYNLYAVWISITYNPNGGTITASEGSPTYVRTPIGYFTNAPGSSFTVNGINYTFSRDGYGLLGWATSQNATEPRYREGDGGSLPTANTTLYAVWGQATLNVNGGTIYRDGSPSGGTTLTIPVGNGTTTPSYTIEKGGSVYTFVREGYGLRGWATTAGATTPTYEYGDPLIIRATQIYYAVWGEVAITIDPNGGTLTYPGESSAGASVTADPTKIPKAPSTLFSVDNTKYIVSRTGYGLLGWATSSSATTPEYTCDADLPESPVSSYTLYAVWAKGVTFDSNGGTVQETGGAAMPNFTAPLSSSYTAPGFQFNSGSVIYQYLKSDATHTYALRGWATSSSATDPDYKPGDTIPASATEYTLYAVWAPGIIFDPNGGKVYDANGMEKAPYVMVSSEPLYVPTYAFTLDNSRYIYAKEGSSFLGWSRDPNAEIGEYTEGNILPSSNTGYSLYAIWSRDSFPLTLVYSDTYSITMNVPYMYKLDLTPQMNYNTGMEGYKIVGWSTVAQNLNSSDNNGAYYIQTTGTRYNQFVMMDSGVGLTLYPIWAKIYTVGNNLNITITNGNGCYYITGTSTSGSVTASGGHPYIFTDALSVTSTTGAAFVLTSGTSVDLTVITDSSFTGASEVRLNNPNQIVGYAGINVPSGTTLTVSEYSVGRLSAQGGNGKSTTTGGMFGSDVDGYSGAGIGTNGNSNAQSCGTIIINGGTVTAISGDCIIDMDAGGWFSSYNTDVTAYPGIGGNNATVTINGGTVTAAIGRIYGVHADEPDKTYTSGGNPWGTAMDPITGSTTINGGTVYTYGRTGGGTVAPDPITMNFRPYDEDEQPCTIGNAYGLTIIDHSIDLAGMTIDKTSTTIYIDESMVSIDGVIQTTVDVVLTTGHQNYFVGTATRNADGSYTATIYERNDQPHGSVNIYANEVKITGTEAFGTVEPSADTTIAGTSGQTTVSKQFTVRLNEGYELDGFKKKIDGVWTDYEIDEDAGESWDESDGVSIIILNIPISSATGGTTTDLSFTITQIKKDVTITLTHSEGAHTFDAVMVTTDNTDAGTIIWTSGNTSGAHKIYYKSSATYTVKNYDSTNHYYIQLITVNGVTIDPIVSADGSEYSFEVTDVSDDVTIDIRFRPTYKVDMTVQPIDGAVCETAYISIVDENGNPVKGLVEDGNHTYIYINANTKVYFKVNDYTEDTSTHIENLGICEITVSMYEGLRELTYTIPAGLGDTYSIDTLTGNATIIVKITASNRSVTYTSNTTHFDFNVKEGAYITLPTEDELFTIDPTLYRKVGYDLLKWRVNEITLTPGSQYHVTNDIEFTAVWSDEPHVYHITFNLDGGESRYKFGEGAYQTITAGTIIDYTILSEQISIDVATRTGYTFAGWEGTDIQSGSESITIPAGSFGDREFSVVRWDPTNITVVYDKNNADSTIVFNPPTFKRLFGGTYGDLPIYSNFEANGTSYSFAGWATDADGIHRITPSTLISNPLEHHIYIVWIINSSDNRIINVVNDGSYGGTVGVDSRSVSPGSDVVVTITPFAGYEPSAISVNGVSTSIPASTTSYTVTIPDDSESENPTLMYYIQVTFVPTKYYIKITHYSDVSPSGEEEYFDTGDYDDLGHPYFTIESQPLYITRSTVGSYAQHSFVGWTGTGITGMESNYVSILTGSIDDRHYYEVWEPSLYTITYYLQDDVEHPASHTNPPTYRTGTALELKKAQRTGYICLGWFKADVGGDLVEVISAESAEDLVLYAHWVEAQAVAKPNVTNFLYDGEAHSGVTPVNPADADGYDMTGDVNKTYAGTYTVTVTLNTGYYWEGADEDHRFDTLTLEWTIDKRDLYISSESLWMIYNGEPIDSSNDDYDTFGMASADAARITITTNNNSYTNAGRYINTITFTDNVTGHLALLSYNIHVYNGSYVIVEKTSTTLTIGIETPGPSLGKTMTVITGHLLDSQPGNVQAVFLRRLA